jgi:glycosyltransferase involved in cell wall biosynthesis
LARKPGGHKSVYYITGPPIPGYQPRLPPDRWFLKQAILRADALAVPSEYVRSLVRGHYGLESTVLPVPLDTSHFSPDPRRRSPRPLILWMGAAESPRKGVAQLIQAFAQVHTRNPEAILRICGQVDFQQQRQLLDLVPGRVAAQIEFPGLGTLDALPDHYREAWVTVQPAKWEAYSLVALESWACGTPVVAVRHGALPEMLNSAELGTLFDPGGPEDQVGVEDLEGFAAAMSQALSAPVPEAQAQACRRKAEGYSWEVLGPRFLAFYEQLLKTPGGSRAK